MKKPLILTIGRQYGSGGREIGLRLAQRLGMEFYDKARLMAIAEARGDGERESDFYEERPVNSLLYAIAMSEMTRSTGNASFVRIRSLMEGKGGVLIGRCGNVIFRQDENAVSVFIHASAILRQQSIAQGEGISLRKASLRLQEVDESRTRFHRYFTGESWGHAQGYELCLDSGILGIDGCVDMILNYLRWRGLLDEEEGT